MWIENRDSYRKRKIICAILGICASLLLTSALMDRQKVIAAKSVSDAQEKMADEVFRFHVLANSDSDEDQELKLKVRDEILVYMKNVIPGDSLQRVKLSTAYHLEEIEQIAREVIKEAGYDYQVNARIVTCYFPDRRYGKVLFPKGYYDALRVEIGAALGHNWWCVLYPSLCFTDATCAVVTEESENELEHVLDRNAYETVTATSTEFKIKSFFYELLKERTKD